ncbi:hypothetical protein ACHAWF_004425 [Thalassiosira exigua]
MTKHCSQDIHGSPSRAVNREFHKISRSNFATLVVLISLASVGGVRRVTTGGLLWRMIGTSRARAGFRASYNSIIPSSFVSAAQLTPSFSRPSSSAGSPAETCTAEKDSDMPSESCTEQPPPMLSKLNHPDDPSLRLYHVERTTSTMDEAKRIVHNEFSDDKNPTSDGSAAPTSFLISATSQSRGRGTTQRNWKSSQSGNALFTIGIQQSSWMNDLKHQNDGRAVPLTLLPLKVGSLVARRIETALEGCAVKSGEQQSRPRVTVKWPNDVLLHSSESSHEKVAGILIESSQDWFLVGIGINVGYAPSIPLEGADYGRRATSLSDYCEAGTDADDDEGNHWEKISKELAIDVAHDLHSWLHPLASSHGTLHSGETILNQWKSYVDWDMELTLRDTPKRERVKLKSILEDGRVIVQEVETGLSRTLVSDYFL